MHVVFLPFPSPPYQHIFRINNSCSHPTYIKLLEATSLDERTLGLASILGAYHERSQTILAFFGTYNEQLVLCPLHDRA